MKQTHKSHQSLQQTNDKSDHDIEDLVAIVEDAEPVLKVNVQSEEVAVEAQPAEVSEPVKVNPTDKAIQLAKERWEHRRAKILQEENPRAK